MTQPDADPDSEETRAFNEPWQARAFAIAITLSERAANDGFPWEDFQSRLAAERATSTEPREDTETAYYEDWVSALESLLIDTDLITAEELETRAHEFHTGDRDASEFVEGDPHAHTHTADQ